jgi:hypothetical protein
LAWYVREESDGLWRMQLGYAVIRRSTRGPRLWWRQIRLYIIWEVIGVECGEGSIEKAEW